MLPARWLLLGALAMIVIGCTATRHQLPTLPRLRSGSFGWATLCLATWPNLSWIERVT